ncbi:MAG: metal-dependent hydrolase [Pseudomonadota bacterium]
MIIGHLAVVGIAKLTYFQRENLAVLVLASFGPDIIDKTANILFGMPGRGVSHSLGVFSLVSILAGIYWLKLTNKPRLLCAVIILWGSHLVGDFLKWQVLLWPFGGHIDPSKKFHLSEKLASYYVELQYPYQLILEIICVTAFLCIVLSKFHKKKPLSSLSLDSLKSVLLRLTNKSRSESTQEKTI